MFFCNWTASRSLFVQPLLTPEQKDKEEMGQSSTNVCVCMHVLFSLYQDKLGRPELKIQQGFYLFDSFMPHFFSRRGPKAT